MSKLTVTCTDFREIQRNTLLGFATINIAEMKMTVSDVAIHEKNGRRWAQLPSKPMVGRDKTVITDNDGKVKYVPIFKFDNKDVERAFSSAVVKAVEDAQFVRDFA